MTIELIAEVSILRAKVEKYERAIEDIKDEILCSYEKITNSQDEINLVKIARNNIRGECIDIINKHIGVSE